MGGPRKFGKLADLTPQIYLNYKRTGLDDRQIARLNDCSIETLGNWKQANGLTNISIRNWELWEKYFPKDIEKMKKQFIELWNRGWKREYIAEEMKMSNGQLARFVDRFLPNYKTHTVKVRLTPEQRALAKKNKLKLNTVYVRIRSGYDIDRALTEPKESTFGQMKIKHDRKWSDLSDEHKRMAKENGIPITTIYKRLERGWTDEMAVTKPSKNCGFGKGKKK